MSMGQIQTSAGGMPVVILREGTRENKGREAQTILLPLNWLLKS
jgi:hypothetical protein